MKFAIYDTQAHTYSQRTFDSQAQAAAEADKLNKQAGTTRYCVARAPVNRAAS